MSEFQDQQADQQVGVFVANHFNGDLKGTQQRVLGANGIDEVISLQDALREEINTSLIEVSMAGLIKNEEEKTRMQSSLRSYLSRYGAKTTQGTEDHSVIVARAAGSRTLIEVALVNGNLLAKSSTDDLVTEQIRYANALSAELYRVAGDVDMYYALPQNNRKLTMDDNWELDLTPTLPIEKVLDDLYTSYKPSEPVKNARAEIKEEFGMSLDDINYIFSTAARQAQQSDIWVGSINDLIEIMTAHRDIDPEGARQIIERFSLKPDNVEVDKPWRFRREYSLVVKPFVNFQSIILFGESSLHHGWATVQEQLATDRYKGTQTKIMSNWSTQNAQRLADEFVIKASKALVRMGYPARPHIVTFDGKSSLKNVNGENLGDIDILLADQDTKTLYLLEAKAWLLPRQPSEFINEKSKFVKKGTEVIHINRREWSRAQIPSALQLLGIEGAADQWSMEAVIMTASPNTLELLCPDLKLKALSFYALQHEKLGSATPPGRKDHCPCNSGRQHRRCCFVD